MIGWHLFVASVILSLSPACKEMFCLTQRFLKFLFKPCYQVQGRTLSLSPNHRAHMVSPLWLWISLFENNVMLRNTLLSLLSIFFPDKWIIIVSPGPQTIAIPREKPLQTIAIPRDKTKKFYHYYIILLLTRFRIMFHFFCRCFFTRRPPIYRNLCETIANPRRKALQTIEIPHKNVLNNSTL